MDSYTKLPNKPVSLREAASLMPEEVSYSYELLRTWALNRVLKRSISVVKLPGAKNARYYVRPRDLAYELRGFEVQNSEMPSEKTLRALNPRFQRLAEERQKGGAA